MKVAQVVSTFPPYHGGMGNVAYSLAEALAKEKILVTIFTPKYSNLDPEYRSIFSIKRLATPFKFGNAALVWQLFFYLWSFDVIHLHYPFIGATLPCLLVKLIRGKKVKLIAHYHMDLVGQNWKKAFFKAYNYLILGSLIRHADKVVATSEDYLNLSELRFYFDAYQNKFVAIPLGVSRRVFYPTPPSPELVHKYGLDAKKVVLFVGGLDRAHYFKGVNYLLKSFGELKDKNAILIIVGDGDLKETYMSLAYSYGLEKRIIFTGRALETELNAFYNLANVFVLPSIDRSEAFGLVLLEAMACQKPVVASDLPGVRQVVGQNERGILVKPKDVKSLTSAINRLLANEDLRFKLGKNGLDAVNQTYNWTNICQQFLKIYQN